MKPRKNVKTQGSVEQERLETLQPAIFLDRDGTINEDPGYLNDPAQMKLLPSVGQALALLKTAGYRLVVVSNQSGVGRGLIKEQAIPKIHERLGELLEPWLVSIDCYSLCFHLPEAQCECRKPKPALLINAAKKLNLDFSRSYMVGDKESDLQAGRNAGCKGVVLVRTGAGQEVASRITTGQADFIGESLLDVAQWILDQENEDS